MALSSINLPTWSAVPRNGSIIGTLRSGSRPTSNTSESQLAATTSLGYFCRHRPRKYGKSKYGVSRLTKGLLDLLTVKFIVGYGQRPQHMLGTAGLLAATYLAAFGASHPLARKVGPWPSVGIVTAAAAGAAYVLADRRTTSL